MEKIKCFAVLILSFLLFASDWISAQGKSWQKVGSSFDAAIWAVTAYDNYIFVGAWGKGLWGSTDYGANWISMSNGNAGTNYIAAIVKSGSYVYVGADSSVWGTTDNGANWIYLSNGLVSDPQIRSLAVTGTYIFVGTKNKGVYRVSASTTWESANVGLPSSCLVNALLVNGTQLYAATSLYGLYRSTNNGDNWTQVTNGFPASIDVYSLAANGTNIYAGVGGGVYCSTDKGNSWKNVSNGLPGSNNYYFSIAASGSNIFTGATGLYYSNNEGESWFYVDNGLPAASDANEIYSITLNGSKVYVGTKAGEVYMNDLSSFLPQPINISGKTITFGDPTKSSGFRMIGLPGQSSGFKVSNFLQGEAKKDWTAFYDNGTQTNYYIEYDGSSTFYFAPGKGFWILSKNPMSLSGEISPVSLTGGYFSIPLHSGWNIISDPYEIPVSWSNVKNTNGLLSNDYIHSWNGTQFSNSAILTPYEGYYFYNSANLTSLKIPYVSANAAGKTIPDIARKTANEGVLSIALRNNSEIYSQIVLGVNINALDDYDSFDCLTPPGDFEEAGIRTINKNISIPWKELSVDFRKQVGNGQSFDFKVKNNTDKNLTLIVAGVESFKDYEVWLLDKRLNNLFDMKKMQTATVPSYVDSASFKLLIGKDDFIRSQKNDLTPLDFSLFQNYPNPFNPFTIIRYSTPVDAFVSLHLYDITGKKVRELENSFKEAGYHEVMLNAYDIASGVYLYRIEIMNNENIIYSSSRKLSLIK